MPWTPSARPWLDRYRDPLPIRSRGAFHLVAAGRLADDRPCVVVLAGPGADARRVREALAEVERIHALVDHPRVPRVAARGEHEGTPFLELACDAVIDGVDLLRLIAEHDEKIPYAAGDGFILSLREALCAAHATVDPATGKPVCIGRLSYANTLFAASGRFWLVGLGMNFPLDRDTGVPDGWTAIFQAPEISMGAPPSPMGDYTALILFMRSLMPYVVMPETMGRILQGDIRPEDAGLFEALRWFERRIFGEPAFLRPSLDEAVAVSDRIREHLGVTPDPEAFEAHAAALVNRGEDPLGEEAPPDASSLLVIGPDAAWIALPGGARNRLGRAHRRIVNALIDNHRRSPGAVLTMWELLEAGWPGERPIYEAGANRVYVALARLRRMGLRDLIERFDDGYRLAPATVVRREL